ncbi:DNA cytosine methyltransferase [Qipengyuania spongiae]|uniref:DNA (cytosine-5-)-methyltransferase n=1 Tax=Qipengyuania spongiae TaxID=2909673 RepID=A0ABY5T1Q3_9SPHN|nr:DNA cytosine methyltransferase [Qipengyuania spongiae]UVI40016.1 DNA cytosine methyltransferase [Qipengyuania spongiae]
MTDIADAPVAASAVDLFCGAGGLTAGLLAEGLPVAAGIDNDAACRFPYVTNNEVPFLERNVAEMTADELEELFTPEVPRILVGCAPCQPFSSYSSKRDDDRWALVERFADLICEVRPDIVSMENVPRLTKFENGSVLRNFVDRLREADYHVSADIVCAADYGVPQKRNRLVLLASRHGPIALEEPPVKVEEHVTVAQAIGDLAMIGAGETDPIDELHRSASLSPRNRDRIRAAKPGGTWRDWDEELVTDCHRAETGKSYPSVYGRMEWNKPAPTMTTQFYGFGNGRFGHPEQDRAISLREGAILQSFDKSYRFVPEGAKIHTKTVGRLIGNAVPVLLGRAIARSIICHMREHGIA